MDTDNLDIMNIFRTKYFKVILILTIICFSLIILSFILDTCVKEKVNEIFSWISGLSTLITLIIALILFEKYGLDKKIEDRQQDAVLALVEDISKMVLILKTDFPNKSTFQTSVSVFTSSIGVSGKIDNNIKEKKMIFGDSYVFGLSKLYTHYQNFWLPDLIKEKFQKIFSYAQIFDENVDISDAKYLRVWLTSENFYDTDIDRKFYTLSPQSNYKFEDFHQKWVDLHNCIIEWIKKNTDIKKFN